MKSHSVTIKPVDSRCRYWAKIVRSATLLPLPRDVMGAGDIPGHYAHRGDDELLPCDVLFEGEANHHRRTDRGWSYAITYVSNDGELHQFCSGFGELRKQLKAQGMSPELLMGAGDVAAMVRIAHGVRAGMTLTEQNV